MHLAECACNCRTCRGPNPAQANCCHCACALRTAAGQILPDGTWCPRHARIEVTPCEPVRPTAGTADVFARAVRLRDAARGAIARQLEGSQKSAPTHSGERDPLRRTAGLHA